MFYTYMVAINYDDLKHYWRMLLQQIMSHLCVLWCVDIAVVVHLLQLYLHGKALVEVQHIIATHGPQVLGCNGKFGRGGMVLSMCEPICACSLE
jgi:hypothetical protein